MLRLSFISFTTRPSAIAASKIIRGRNSSRKIIPTNASWLVTFPAHARRLLFCLLTQLKSALTSVPLRPQAWQRNRGLEIGKPDVIRPLVGADFDILGALIMQAINQQPANVHFASFTERYFLGVLHPSSEI